MEKAGKKLKCKRCGGTATIILEDGRYTVFCSTCQTTELLKTYSIAPQATQCDLSPVTEQKGINTQVALFEVKLKPKSPYDY